MHCGRIKMQMKNTAVFEQVSVYFKMCYLLLCIVRYTVIIHSKVRCYQCSGHRRETLRKLMYWALRGKYHQEGRRKNGNPVLGLTNERREAGLGMQMTSREKVWIKADILSQVVRSNTFPFLLCPLNIQPLWFRGLQSCQPTCIPLLNWFPMFNAWTLDFILLPQIG